MTEKLRKPSGPDYETIDEIKRTYPGSILPLRLICIPLLAVGAVYAIFTGNTVIRP